MPMPAWQTTQAARSITGGVWDEALDPHVGRRREVSRVDVGGRDHRFEQLPGERLAGGLDDAAVVLEERRAGDQHERRFDVVEPGGTVGGGLPEPGADEPYLGGPVGARILERLGGEGEDDRGGQVDVVQGTHRRQADLGPQRVHVQGHHVLERAEREPASHPVAHTADEVVPRGEAEPEWWRVARRQRHRRDDRERPRETRSLRRRRRTPGALVDQQHVGTPRLDRRLQVGDLEAGPLAELAQPGAERAEASAGTPVLGLEALDLRC